MKTDLKLNRRNFSLASAALVMTACTQSKSYANAENELTDRKVTTETRAKDEIMSDSDWANLSTADWKDRLTQEEFYVLRKEGTERPWTSEFNNEKRDGTYVCAGCALPLFKSETKFDSGTGWPSFFDKIDGAVATKRDFKLGLPRTEYHCSRCGGHQGHVFKDGPRPTGLRYCNNGVALDFIPQKA